MKFYLNGQFITLHGGKDPTATVGQFYNLKCLHAIDAIAEAYALQVQDTGELIAPALQPPEDTPLELATLLTSYKDVFYVPHGLPPHRPFDHCIQLKGGTPHVKVKPYRYPF